MKIGAIDVGTNSCHLLVARVDAQGSITPLERAKDLVRLGDSAFSGGISPAATAHAIDTLRRFRSIVERHGCDALVAVATSAVREAENGGDFVRAVRDHTRIELTVVRGDEEARLIYLGARSALDLRGRRALIVDIGGGSVELIVGDAHQIFYLASLKLGVLRLLAEWKPSDPPTPDERMRLAEKLHRALEAPLSEARRVGFEFVAMTSGSPRAIADLVPPSPDASKPRRVPFAAVYALEQQLCRLDATARARLPSLDAKRVDSIVPGTIFVRTLLEVAHADEYVICEGALREGLLVDFAARNRPGIALVDEFPDRRRRSVVALARRCQVNEAHAQQVARLALDLFRGTRPLHNLPNSDGELLEFAALLHDIGYHIAASKHHKHGAYIIENVGLDGFSPEEQQLIAMMVRYHRKATPKEQHDLFGKLPERGRHRLQVLAALVRLAEGLDRGFLQRVRGLRCVVHEKTVDIILSVTGDPELELWGARRKADLFQEVFGRKPHFVIEENHGGQ